MTRKITVEVSDVVYSLLEVLARASEHGPSASNVEGIVLQLIDHAQQGVYRPGAWEREWLTQAFGDDWVEHLVPGDPYGRDDGRTTSPTAPGGLAEGSGECQDFKQLTDHLKQLAAGIAGRDSSAPQPEIAVLDVSGLAAGGARSPANGGPS